MELPWTRGVLTPEGRKNVAAHKYVAGAYTPLDNMLNPFWVSIAEVLPMWLAPNLVTLIGFIPMVLIFVMTWAQSPFFDTPPSRGFALLVCLLNFFYQTMDAVDGKQARRTGSSSPLGQLFDHGCDCLGCIAQHSVAMMVTIPGPCMKPLFILACIQTGFFLAQWYERYSHFLPTSYGPVGVTELQLIWIGAALGAAIVGPDALKSFLETEVPVPFVGPTTFLPMLIVVWFVSFSVIVLLVVQATLKKAAENGGSKVVAEAFSNLLPVAVLNLCLFAVWDSSAIELYPRRLVLATGMRFFFCTAQVILFSMAKMPVPTLQATTLLPYLALALASKHLSAEQLGLALALDATAVSLWVFNWLCTVARELTEELNIYVFSLRRPPNSSKVE